MFTDRLELSSLNHTPLYCRYGFDEKYTGVLGKLENEIPVRGGFDEGAIYVRD